MLPCTTSPRSARSRLEMAFKVLLLPAPLAPSSTAICPLATCRETPRTARMAFSYSTSMPCTCKIGMSLMGLSWVNRAQWPAHIARQPVKESGFLAAITRGDALFGGVFFRRGFNDRPQQLAVGLHPVADQVPFGAVPLLEAHGTAAFVVRAGQLQRLHQAQGAQLFEARVVQFQMLKAPAYLFACKRLLAVLLLGNAHGFDVENAVHHAEVVVHVAEAFRVGKVALPLVYHVFFDALQHRELGARGVRGDGDIAFCSGTCRGGVVFGVAPDVA